MGFSIDHPSMSCGERGLSTTHLTPIFAYILYTEDMFYKYAVLVL